MQKVMRVKVRHLCLTAQGLAVSRGEIITVAISDNSKKEGMFWDAGTKN